MKPPTATQERIAHMLEQMRLAMPEIRRQIEVYEKKKAEGKLTIAPKVAPQFKNG